jgi:endogenous inhibitor of DNA gyrase (YacG/DUF329 family)
MSALQLRGELETLLTLLTVSTANTPQGKPETLLTPANVNPVNRPCPQCGKPVTGQKTAKFCSEKCRYAALSAKRKAARGQAREAKATPVDDPESLIDNDEDNDEIDFPSAHFSYRDH